MKRLILALVILTMILCVGCGKAAEPAETETAPETVEIAPVETATPSPEPTPEPTPSPTPEPPSEPGTVLINGAALEEAYVPEHSLGQCNIPFPYQVQMDTVFVMGDNRTAALDSRLSEIGTIPIDRIIGKVILTF